MKQLILLLGFFALFSLTAQNHNQNQEAATKAVTAMSCSSKATVNDATANAKCCSWEYCPFAMVQSLGKSVGSYFNNDQVQAKTEIVEASSATPSCKKAVSTPTCTKATAKPTVTQASFSGSFAALCAPFCPPGCCSLPCNSKTQKSEDVSVGELVAK